MILCIVIILVSLVVLIRGKGWVGEWRVSHKLRWLPSDKYQVINDVLLPTNYGTTQIDHIVISIYGVFIIETKNYKGTISGGPNSEMWAQNIFGNKYSMPNPIRQNKVHMAAVCDVLNKYHIVCDVRSIIVFMNGVNVYASEDNCDIVYFRKLKSTIRKYQKEQLSPQQVKEALNAIKAVNITSLSARKEHVRNVQQTRKQRNLKVANGICPRCGGKLILRNGQYGAFYGCSNYPKCHYIKNN